MRSVTKRGVIGAAACAVCLGPVATAEASQVPNPTWRIVNTLPLKADSTELTSIAAVGPKRVFTVGSEKTGRRSLAQLWDGVKWRDVPLPAPFGPNRRSGLTKVVASGSKNVWAFGYADGGTTQYALRFEGGRYVVKHRWKTPNRITDAAVLGPKDIWVVGANLLDEFGVWHFNGRKWSRAALPFALTDISAVSPRNIWAVGEGKSLPGSDKPIVARYNGKKWRVVPAPIRAAGGRVVLTDISAGSPTNVWVSGHRAAGTGRKGLALRWNGTKWMRKDPPVGDSVTSITAFGKNRVFANPGGNFMHQLGGRWIKSPTPNVPHKLLRGGEIVANPAGGWWSIGSLLQVGYPTSAVVMRLG